jgi:CRP-like cAMP-binding protein
VLRSLSRVGFRRGLLGGSRPWTVLFVVAGSLRLLRRIAEGKEVVFSETLEPGTTLVITNDPAGVPLAAEAVLTGGSGKLEA